MPNPARSRPKAALAACLIPLKAASGSLPGELASHTAGCACGDLLDGDVGIGVDAIDVDHTAAAQVDLHPTALVDPAARPILIHQPEADLGDHLGEAGHREPEDVIGVGVHRLAVADMG